MTMNCNNDKNNNKPRYIDFTVAPKPGLWTMWTMFGGWLRRRHAGFVPRWEEWQNTCILWWRIWIFFCFACQFWIAFLFSYFEIRRKFWLLYHRSTTTTSTTTPTITTPTMTTTSTTSTTRTTAATTSSYVSRCYFFLFVFFLIFPDSVEPAIGVTKSDDPMIHQLEDVAENVPSSQNKPLLFLWLDVFF